jgi:hypothetical protein
MNTDLYDSIGHGYAATRGTDPRIAARLRAVRGPARRHQLWILDFTQLP